MALGLDSFISAQKAAREDRALEKKREHAAIVIQSGFRGFRARKSYQQRVLADLDDILQGE